MQNAFFTFLLTVCCIGTLSRAEEWGYPNFPKWGGICDHGTKQSPINLDSNDAIRVSYDELSLTNYRKPQENLELVNNGHTIMVTGFNHLLALNGGSLQYDYVLEQFHMHWESEHTIDGSRYPLEIHFVHRNTMYPNVETAKKYENGIAVVAALYHVSNSDNYEIGCILKGLDAVKSYSQIKKPVQLEDPIVLMDLVPSLSKYYVYPGSLTTPSCAEAVTWFVLAETYPVSRAQLNKLQQIEYEAGKQLRFNFRELQKQGNREVYLVSEAPVQARVSVPIALILMLVFVNQKFFL